MGKKKKCNPNPYAGSEPHPCTAYIQSPNHLVKGGKLIYLIIELFIL